MGSSEAPWCKHAIQANRTAITQRTGTEALNVQRIAKCYLKNGTVCSHPQIVGMSFDRVNECGNISLIPPASELQGTANAFRNLNKLLHMYHYIWRYLELHHNDGEFLQTESPKLDMLGIVYFRFSNQVERYLQVHRCSCNDTQCTVQGIDKKEIEQEIHQKLQTATCTHKLLLNVIMQDLRKVANDTLQSLTCRHSPNCPDTYSLYPYQLCHSLRTIPITCNTIKS